FHSAAHGTLQHFPAAHRVQPLLARTKPRPRLPRAPPERTPGHQTHHPTAHRSCEPPRPPPERATPRPRRSRASPRPAGLRSEIREESAAAGGGRGTFAEEACRSRRGPSDQDEPWSTAKAIRSPTTAEHHSPENQDSLPNRPRQTRPGSSAPSYP